MKTIHDQQWVMADKRIPEPGDTPNGWNTIIVRHGRSIELMLVSDFRSWMCVETVDRSRFMWCPIPGLQK